MTKIEFYDKWLSVFASGISKEDMEKYIVSYGNFIWHAFSWELLDKSAYLVGDAARAAYDSIDKSDAICLRWFDDDRVQGAFRRSLYGESIGRSARNLCRFKDFTWTYIKTHERDLCGPYFMKQ